MSTSSWSKNAIRDDQLWNVASESSQDYSRGASSAVSSNVRETAGKAFETLATQAILSRTSLISSTTSHDALVNALFIKLVFLGRPLLCILCFSNTN